MKRFDTLANRLAKTEAPLSNIMHTISQIDELSIYDDIEKLKLLGLPLVKTNESYATVNTRLTPLEEQLFCIVDIETSSSDIKHGQIIEIGAVLVKNCQEIDRFESLVYATEVPPAIEELTGIDAKQLEHAPSLHAVLEKFRLFIKDAVFVAHNVKFDFNYISDSFESCGFGPMLNRKLCTIDLAKKSIKAERYGLEYLRESLDLEKGEQHRAFWDAYNAKEVFCICLENIPDDIFTAEELIRFSNPNQTKKRKKKTQKPKKQQKVQKPKTTQKAKK